MKLLCDQCDWRKALYYTSAPDGVVWSLCESCHSDYWHDDRATFYTLSGVRICGPVEK